MFETFPFPEALDLSLLNIDLSDNPQTTAIREAAKNLNNLRDGWLNPPGLIRQAPELAEGFPIRMLPIDRAAESELRKRTLTTLYNQRPTWLNNAHAELDSVVAAAYGWQEDISDDDALNRLLKLNLERAAAQPS